MSLGKEILEGSQEAAYKYTLKNANGITLVCTNFGATILQLLTPDIDGTIENITIAYQTLHELQNPPGRPYFGAIIGRFCNRIEKGHLELDGQTYQLFLNNGPNHLHGGQIGFDRRLWHVVNEIHDSGRTGLEFEYLSVDGEENYPGNLRVNVKYELTDEDQLIVTFHATTDKTTVVNLTNHTYWNLSGNAKDKIYDNRLQLGASHYLPVNEFAIPSGEIRSVKGEPFDFTTEVPLKDQMLQINGGGKPGIDHCFVIDGALDEGGNYVYNPDKSLEYLRFAAKVTDPNSGRTITTHTTQPGIQFYTANFLLEDPVNHPFTVHNAFCLETQHFPDSPNKPNFPTVTLRPNEIYHHKTIYSFGIISSAI